MSLFPCGHKGKVFKIWRFREGFFGKAVDPEKKRWRFRLPKNLFNTDVKCVEKFQICKENSCKSLKYANNFQKKLFDLQAHFGFGKRFWRQGKGSAFFETNTHPWIAAIDRDNDTKFMLLL